MRFPLFSCFKEQNSYSILEGVVETDLSVVNLHRRILVTASLCEATWLPFLSLRWEIVIKSNYDFPCWGAWKMCFFRPFMTSPQLTSIDRWMDKEVVVYMRARVHTDPLEYYSAIKNIIMPFSGVESRQCRNESVPSKRLQMCTKENRVMFKLGESAANTCKKKQS